MSNNKSNFPNPDEFAEIKVKGDTQLRVKVPRAWESRITCEVINLKK